MRDLNPHRDLKFLLKLSHIYQQFVFLNGILVKIVTYKSVLHIFNGYLSFINLVYLFYHIFKVLFTRLLYN